MKKVKILLIAIIGIFAISTIKVYASIKTGTDPDTSLEYSIESFNVMVRNGEGLKNINEAADNNEKSWQENIDASELNIEPSSHVYKLKNNAQLITVKLNAVGGIDKIKELLENTVRTKIKEKLKNGNNERYFCSFSVIYKITKLPSGTTNIVDVDHKNVFSETQERQDVTVANGASGISQMIYTEIYDKTNDSFEGNDAQLEYDGGKIITARESDMPIFDEYYLMSDANKEGQEVYRFMVHDRDDLMDSDYFKQDLDESELPPEPSTDKSDDDDDATDEKTPVTPSKNNNSNNNSNNDEKITGVPDTAARNASITLFGSSVLALGSGVVLWELRKKFN